MFGLHGPELIIILLIVLVIFGGSKIPQLMRGLGEGMKEFKRGSREDPPDEEPAPKETRAGKKEEADEEGQG